MVSRSSFSCLFGLLCFESPSLSLSLSLSHSLFFAVHRSDVKIPVAFMIESDYQQLLENIEEVRVQRQVVLARNANAAEAAAAASHTKDEL
jgi:hypothetical protein